MKEYRIVTPATIKRGYFTKVAALMKSGYSYSLACERAETIMFTARANKLGLKYSGTWFATGSQVVFQGKPLATRQASGLLVWK